MASRAMAPSASTSAIQTNSLQGRHFKSDHPRTCAREGSLHRITTQHPLAAIGLAAALVTLTAKAQESPPVRVRGTIERVDGQDLMVKSRNGPELKVVLDDNALIVAVVKASLSDIKPGSFVGISATPQPDGSQRAAEVHIFPEAMRGTGEGHYAWDLRPQSTMTNGNIEQAVAGVDGQTLTVRYKDGEKKISVPPDTPIVSYVPSDRSELKSGIKIFIGAATKQADGTLRASRVNFGKDGLNPPM
jgi:hypothetical protein